MENSELLPIKKRRIRYKGTHPRHFEEKYKELQGDTYAVDVQKVRDRGQTPAGTHRPICVDEILQILNPKPGMTGLDATLGYGGHAQELLKRIMPDGRLFGLDVDPIELPKTESRLLSLGYTKENLITRRMNFAGLPQLQSETVGGFDFILADLGVSSMQIDTPTRGFSFKIDGPLDLRLNPSRGQPVSQLLKTLTVDSLIEILTTNADEPYSRLLAPVILDKNNNITRTQQLATTIKNVLSTNRKTISADEIKKSQQRVFQALRIHVNDEFAVLDQFLSFLPMSLKSQGRVAILTFHSGEDRRVKKSLLHGFRTGIYKEIARKPIRPTSAERHSNPRSSCAKLRWAEKA